MKDANLDKAMNIMKQGWPRPFERNPMEDGRFVAMLPIQLGAQIFMAVDDEFNRGCEELVKLKEMVEGSAE